MIKKGDTVSVEYEGRFEDGEVFDTSQHGDHAHPLEFTVGEQQVIAGFDEAVLGMNVGEEKEFSIPPENAYGPYDDRMRQTVPRAALPPEFEPKEGMQIGIGTPTGQQIPARIVAVDAETVTLDINHPLAGKTLIFKIKVVSVQSGLA